MTRVAVGGDSRNCPFWQKVADTSPGIFDKKTTQRYVDFINLVALKSRHTPWLWTSFGRSKLVDAIPKGFLEDLSRLYRGVQSASGASVIVDSSKFAAYLFLLKLVPDLDIKSVHLVRDPRAVAFSWQRTASVREGDTNDESLQFHDRSVFVAALDWLLQNVSSELVERLQVDRVHRLRYEDFIRDPIPTIGELVGRDSQLGDGSNAFSIDLPEVHIFGNPSRFNSGSITLELDDEWRRQMRTFSQYLVTGVSSPLLRRYRYPVR